MELSTNTIHLTAEDPTLASIIDYLDNNGRTFNIATEKDLDEELKNTYRAVLAHKQLLNNMNGVKERPKLTDLELAFVLVHTLPLVRIAYSALSSKADTNLYMFIPYDNHPNLGLYEECDEFIEIHVSLLQQPMSMASRKNILSYVTMMAPMKRESLDSAHVVVNNGIFNKETKQLEPFTPDFVATSKIQTNYVPVTTSPVLLEPDGTPWTVDNWIMELADHDPEKNELLWQVLAASFNPGHSYNKAILFVSREGNNGKGTYGQLIKNIVGLGNYSSLKIHDYSKRFEKKNLIGKVVNIADENPVGVYIDNVDDFKAAVTGDDISIEPKHKDSFPAVIKHVTIQMINGMPKFRDKTNSFYRRLVMVPFDHTFEGVEKKYIKSHFIQDPVIKEYVLSKALEMDQFDTFIVPEATKTLLSEYKSENNNVFEFWDDMYDIFQWDVIPTKLAYPVYKEWMKEFNANSVTYGRNQFVQYTRDWGKETGLLIDKSQRSDRIRITNQMDPDEPLITKYAVKEFYDPSYKGADDEKRRAFDRSRFQTTRGFVKTPPE